MIVDQIHNQYDQNGENSMESLRNESIQRIKERLSNLGEPQLIPASRVGELNSRLCPSLRDEGLYPILIDPRILEIVFEECGLDEKDTKKINVTFDAGRLGDTDFHGRVYGGLAVENNILVLSSVSSLTALTPEERLNQTRQKHWRLTDLQVIETLLHEIRHQIQFHQNLFPHTASTFDAINHDEMESETDAVAFSQELVKSMSPFIKLQSNAESVPFDQESAKELSRSNLSSIIDGSGYVETIIDRPLGWEIFQTIKKIDFAQVDLVDIDKVIGSMYQPVTDRLISTTDLLFLLKTLRDGLTNSGNYACSIHVENMIKEILSPTPPRPF